MIVVNKRARDIKFSHFLGKCYMNAVNVYVNVTTIRQKLSSSHNIFVNVSWLLLLWIKEQEISSSHNVYLNVTWRLWMFV
jgi:hypothetical protein